MTDKAKIPPRSPGPGSAKPLPSPSTTAAVASSDATVDALFEQWVQSPEAIRTRGMYLVLLSAGALGVYGGGALLVVGINESQVLLMVSGSAMFVAGLAGGAIGFLKRSAARANFYERQERAAKAGVDEAIDQLGDDFDLRGLLRLNRHQMAAYESLTRRQAASSYRLSHIALAVGLTIVVGGAAAAILTDGGATKAATAGLAALAAALAGFIARTYLRIYERTLMQLNYYFEQPLVTSYVLTAERLAGAMTDDRRDDALDRIIQQLLGRLVSHTAGTPQGHADVTDPAA